MKIRRVLLGLVLALALMPVARVQADAQDFYFEDFTADYYLTKDEEGVSNLHVKEVLTAVFPETDQNHGITRTIPFLNQDDKNRTVASEEALNLKVWRNGEPEPVAQIAELADCYGVRIGRASEYVHGRQVYTLEYDYHNVIMEFNGMGANVSGKGGANVASQELYWDTNGTDWGQRFDKLTARLHMPEEILAQMSDKAWCYVGESGESGSSRCTISKLEDGIGFETEKLMANENLTFVTQYKPGTFVVTRERSYILVIALIAEVALAGAIMLKRITSWNRKARNTYKIYESTFVAPQYQPPENGSVRVAEGEQISVKKTKPSYVATLLELAVDNLVTIKKEPDWSVCLNVDRNELSSSQLYMLKILNGGKTVTKGEDIDIKKHKPTKQLADDAELYKVSAQAALKKNGYLVENGAAGDNSIANIIAMSVIKLIGILFGLGFIYAVAWEYLKVEDYVEIVGGAYLPIVMFVVLIIWVVVDTAIGETTRKYQKYTEKGILLARYLEGLELYIKMAEKDRLAFLQSVEGADTSTEGIVKLYEKLLPWACLFGQEESWLKELAEYYEVEEIPEEFNPDLVRSMVASNILSDIGRNINSSTSYRESSGGWSSGGGSGGGSSSFSSGGGGGGSSGGGGGGGGGGGW